MTERSQSGAEGGASSRGSILERHLQSVLLATALGLDSDQLDDLFRAAAGL